SPNQCYIVFPSVSNEPTHLITGSTSNSVTLNTALLSQVPANSNYYIIRPPRVMQGEPMLQLPQSVAVDFSQLNGSNLSMPSTPNLLQLQGYVDVVFNSSGAVQVYGLTTQKYIFWVRDTSLDTPFQGPPALIVVYARTGSIAGHPVNA